MGARTKARKRAIDLLFEAESRGVDADELAREREERPVTPAPLNPYTVTATRGVVAHWDEINEALTTYSQGWSLDRMPDVDRSILRLGAWEILFCEEVPDGVAVSEAVALATELSTDESPKFVNGLLARIIEVKATLV